MNEEIIIIILTAIAILSTLWLYIWRAIPTIQEVLFPLKRILLVGILFFGFRNLIELIGLIYYNRKL